MIETWAAIKGFPGYEVSTHGRVRNVETNRVLRPFLRGYDNAYLGVDLCRGKARYPKLVHRLVAAAFLPKPANRRRREVNHIDCDPTNNCVENLEWCTRAENEAHKPFWAFARFEEESRKEAIA